MKNPFLAALAAVVLAGSAFAYTPGQSEQVHATKLVPTKIVNPTELPRTFKPGTVQIEFSIDPAGQPRDIKVLSNTDRATKQRIIAAFSQWRFEMNEAPDATKRFVLPLEIVAGVDTKTTRPLHADVIAPTPAPSSGP